MTHQLLFNLLCIKFLLNDPTTPPLNLRLLLPALRMRRLSAIAAPCRRDMDYISQIRSEGAVGS